MRFLLVGLVLMVTSFMASAQELQCAVSVVHRQIQGTNTSVFKTLETSITEFLNGRKWTNDNFKPHEKISCNILINLSEQDGNQFKGNISIQARRPVYGSGYNTSLINYRDNDFAFSYTEFESLNFNENSYDKNLTAVLAYYAYYILGLDYDSFSEAGGTPYFQKAEKIVNNAQNASVKGWKPLENSRNRYWLVEQALHGDFKKYRQFYYQYHRLGLDMMSQNAEKGIVNLTEAFSYLEEVQKLRPASVTFQMLFDAKFDEIIRMLARVDDQKKEALIQLLKRIDPGHLQDYNEVAL